MRLRLHLLRPVHLLVFTVCALATTSLANPALTNWQTARLAFQRAGATIDEADLTSVRQQLTAASTNLPAPYGALAAKFAAQLEVASRLPDGKDKPARSKALVDLCAALGAYDQALKLQAKFSDQEDLQDDPAYAWRLFESGQTQAAITEYRRRIKEEMVDTFAEHYREQLRLLVQRATNLNNVTFSLKLVKAHYLRGFEEKADVFGALQELHRVLPVARDSAESVEIIAAIIIRLNALGDTAGRDAWENQILTRYPNESAACANVHLERGMRAFGDKDYPAALALFRKVANEYPGAPAWGDAQYTLALIHQREGRNDEAIMEYQKIFPSAVRDHDLDVNKSDDCKNYRHRTALRISECYVAKQDLPTALNYAEAARDKYIYVSYCKNCLRDSQESLARRIADLKGQISTPANPNKN